MKNLKSWMLLWGLIVTLGGSILFTLHPVFPFWLALPLLSLFAVVVFSAIFYFRAYKRDFADIREALNVGNSELAVNICLFFAPFALSLFLFALLLGMSISGQQGIDMAVTWLKSPVIQMSVVLTLTFFAIGDYKAQSALSADTMKRRPFYYNFHYLDIPFAVTASVLLLFDMGFYGGNAFRLLSPPNEWPIFLGGATAFQLLAQNTAFVWVTNNDYIG